MEELNQKGVFRGVCYCSDVVAQPEFTWLRVWRGRGRVRERSVYLDTPRQVLSAVSGKGGEVVKDRTADTREGGGSGGLL